MLLIKLHSLEQMFLIKNSLGQNYTIPRNLKKKQILLLFKMYTLVTENVVQIL